ncbi:MAG: hypothetical protein GTN93_29005 [Anaerolineae bacterium]|nr:hypothetical protein [Anaerolineae bacterium]NIQ82045.1 hypothetical protein [Anaerolineae bacterium]
MPIYDFQCPNGHAWDALVSFERAKAGLPCTECGETGEKLVSGFNMGVPKTFSMDRRRQVIDERKKRQAQRAQDKVDKGEMTNDQMWAMAAAGKRSKVSPYLMDPKKDGKDMRPAAVEKREKSTGHFHDEIEM